jgi:hypothetical protein
MQPYGFRQLPFENPRFDIVGPMKTRTRLILIGLLPAVIAAVVVLVRPDALRSASSAVGTPHKVHVAFGMHVNLYHSFRNDTNDENGFGHDIRVIRHTIDTLDQANRDGIPVKAVWDIDNLFSLQEILPENAPDIISDIQRRVGAQQDEVILMSYNNGLMSAMTRPEFTVAVERAITNGHGSGVADLFGRAAPIVRPQEMMTTPGHFDLYRKLGVPYVALYYSATPFDAFRVFSRQLTWQEAYNPVRYRHPQTGEQGIIIPTYHIGDLVEHVGLRHWVEKLHRLQISGEIDSDVLLFINFDADADFWSGADVSWYLKWLPNTGGLDQLVRSVANLDYVRFTNLSDYVAVHPPQGSVHFGQDTADGSFNGYSSWAEKANVSAYWSRIVCNRRAQSMITSVMKAGGIQPPPPEIDHLMETAMSIRLRALSTTHFGLASPFLTRQREAAVETLLSELDQTTRRLTDKAAEYGRRILEAAAPPAQVPDHGEVVDRFLHLNPTAATGAARGARLDFRLPAGSTGTDRYVIVDGRGAVVPVRVIESGDGGEGTPRALSLAIPGTGRLSDGVYFLCRLRSGRQPAPASAVISADRHRLRNRYLQVDFDANGHVARVALNGIRQLDAGSLLPFAVYGGDRLIPGKLDVMVENPGRNGVASVRLTGGWDGPTGKTSRDGRVDCRLRLVEGLPYLFIESTVAFPETFRRDTLAADRPMLARKYDASWIEAGPAELRFSHRGRRWHPFRIHKRNFLGRESSYRLDYDRHSAENLNLDNVNNHITAEYAGISVAGYGMAVAMDTTVSANFAFCPFRTRYDAVDNTVAIRANPFGTYHGHQYRPPTRGSGQGYEATLLSGPQFASPGPTYNGHRERIHLMIAFFKGHSIPNDVENDLIGFARPPMTLAASGRPESPVVVAASDPPSGLMAMPLADGVVLHWEPSRGSGIRYRLLFRDTSGRHTHRIDTAATSTILSGAEIHRRLSGARRIVAAVRAISADGRELAVSDEIRFDTDSATHAKPVAIPIGFQARYVWHHVSAWLQRQLL